MTIKVLHQAMGMEQQTLHICGSALIGASGAVTSQTFKGATLAYDGTTGDYTITLNETYPRLLFANVAVEDVSGDGDFTVVMKDIGRSAATAVKFTVMTGGVPADPASGDYLWFNIVAKRSTAV